MTRLQKVGAVVAIASGVIAILVGILIAREKLTDPGVPARRLLASKACYPYEIPAPLIQYFQNLDDGFEKDIPDRLRHSYDVSDMDKVRKDCWPLLYGATSFIREQAIVSSGYARIRTQCTIDLKNIGAEPLTNVHVKIPNADFTITRNQPLSLFGSAAQEGLKPPDEVEIGAMRPGDEQHIISWSAYRNVDEIVVSHGSGMAEYKPEPLPHVTDLALWVNDHPFLSGCGTLILLLLAGLSASFFLIWLGIVLGLPIGTDPKSEAQAISSAPEPPPTKT